MREIVVVVVGCMVQLCFLAVFAFVFRPRDFRRHGVANATPRRPGSNRDSVPQSPEATLASYTAAVIERQWPPTPRTSDVPEPPVDAS
jgi:hypothetical protein